MTTHRIYTLLVVFTFAFTLTAQAQPASSARGLSSLTPFVPGAPVGVLAGLDASTLDAEDWNDLSKVQTHLLSSPDAQTREFALQNIIFFATNHSEAVNFKRATLSLYNIYRYDRNEDYRIMALVAIHAIGHKNTMLNINQRVKLEKSARVRRYTQAALADYFRAREQ